MTARPTIFISYAHADERWKNKLLVQLKAVFGQDPPIEPWDDRRIRVGASWRTEIQEALARARAAVLMISADFLSSDFIQRAELPILLKRRQQEGVHLLPLLVCPCPWQHHHWLAELQMWPHDARPLKGHPHADTQLAHFAGLVEARLRPPPPKDPWARLGVGSEPAKAPQPCQDSAPRPAYRDQHTRQKGEALATAYQQRQSLSKADADTTAIDTRILGLKRELRQGPQLQPGEFLGNGRYQLINDLGHGGFATVWLAYDREETQRVAIKVLHGQFTTSEERRERLFRGARQVPV